MCYLLNCFQQVVQLNFLWGLPTSKGVCLPYSDESCRTKAMYVLYVAGISTSAEITSIIIITVFHV